MIFLSHNFKDKQIVEPIAITLANVFGVNKVFYDSWSIQPGDGIIDKMNQGLKECNFFFFFVSKNSLDSKMVKLEWQNALYKATHNKVKLIPVKLDDCLMPDILIQNLYIDIYGKGIEAGLRQMIDVINNVPSFAHCYQTFENIRGYILKESTELELHIQIRAEIYFEPLSRYIFLFENSEDEITVDTINQIKLQSPEFLNNVQFADNKFSNGIYFRFVDPTVPHFPIKFVVKRNTSTPIKFIGIMKAVGEDKIRAIPVIIE